MEGIRRHLIGNTLAIAAARVVTMLSSLMVTPFLIGILGIDGYGVWELLLATVGWIGLVDGGLGGALLRYVSSAYARDDRQAVKRFVGVGVFLYAAMGACVSGACWVLRMEIVSVFRIPHIEMEAASTVLPVVVAMPFLNGVTGALGTVISGAQKIGINNWIAAVASLCGAGISILALSAGYGLVGMAVGQLGGGILAFALTALLIRRLFGWLPFGVKIPSRKEVRLLYGYASKLFVAKLSDLLGGHTDKLLLGIFLSPAWVAYYGIATRLTGIVREFMVFMYGPLVPAAIALGESKNWEGIRKLYTASIVLLACSTGALAVVVGGLHLHVESIWLGKQFSETSALVVGLVLATMLHMNTAPGTAICRALDRVGLEAQYASFSFVTNLALTPLLILTIGPLGTVIATMVAMSSGSLFFFRVLHRATDLPFKSTLRASRAFVAASICIGMGYALARFVGVPDGRGEALLFFVLLSIPCLAAYGALLKAFRVITLSEVLSYLGLGHPRRFVFKSGVGS